MTFSKEAGESVLKGSVDSVKVGDGGVGNAASDGSPKRRTVFDKGSGVGERAEVRGEVDVEACEPSGQGELKQLLRGKWCTAGAKYRINRLENSRFYKLRVGQNKSAGHDARVVGGAVANDGGDDGPGWLEGAGGW